MVIIDFSFQTFDTVTIQVLQQRSEIYAAFNFSTNSFSVFCLNYKKRFLSLSQVLQSIKR